eukprot:4831206-Pyramimonas_sp.AAC.1
MYWVGDPHAVCATGTFGGAPSGATRRCTGRGNRMRTAPLGPSVELPWCHETLYWAGEPRANCAAGAFGGTPSEATKCCAGR